MKRVLLSLLLVVISVAASAKEFPTVFAHRGCWSKNSEGVFIIPENSVAAVAMAARMGYAGIECDVKYTKDSVMVLMHDKTMNRTVRHAADYSKIEKPISVGELTYEQLCRDYVLESENPEFRTAVPTLEQLLTECKKQGIIPMLHSSIEESYKMAQSMFGDEWICFTTHFELLKKVREYSNCTILYAIDKGTTEQVISDLKQLGGKCGVSTMKHKLYTPQFCKALTEAGYIVQASVFNSPREVVAQRNGITYQLTDFSIMPTHKPYDKWNKKAKHFSKTPTCNHKWEKSVECGALLLQIEYQGSIEVVINGSRRYTLHRDTLGCDNIGNRLFNTCPQIQITAKDNAKIKRASTSVFEY